LLTVSAAEIPGVFHAFVPATNLARGFRLKASAGGKRKEAHHGVVFAAPLMTTIIAELGSSLPGEKHVAGYRALPACSTRRFPVAVIRGKDAH
jgi:hypothetical protein